MHNLLNVALESVQLKKDILIVFPIADIILILFIDKPSVNVFTLFTQYRYNTSHSYTLVWIYQYILIKFQLMHRIINILVSGCICKKKYFYQYH